MCYVLCVVCGVWCVVCGVYDVCAVPDVLFVMFGVPAMCGMRGVF